MIRFTATRLALFLSAFLTFSSAAMAQGVSPLVIKAMFGRTVQATQPAGTGPVAWSSSNPAVAEVDAKGQVTLIRRGTVKITGLRGAISRTTSVTVTGFSKLARTVDSRACAVDDDKTEIYCWGTNLWTLPFGGVGQVSAVPAPRRISRGDIPASARIEDVSLGTFAACVLTDAGAVHCFGSAGPTTPLGRGPVSAPAQTVLAPVQVKLDGGPASAIAVGPASACAALSAAVVQCWGSAQQIPQVGPQRNARFIAVPMAAALGPAAGGAVSALDVSTNGGCLLAAGQGYCWSGADLPVRVEPGDGAGAALMAIRSDDFHCALDQKGQTYCAGAAFGARFGRGQADFTQTKAWLAVDQSQSGPFRKITLGGISNVACGISQSGEAWCWGKSHMGSAGDGTMGDHAVLRPTKTLRGARPAGVAYTDISCGQYHCLGLGDDGRIYGWGSNEGKVLGPDPTGRSPGGAQPVLLSPPVS